MFLAPFQLAMAMAGGLHVRNAIHWLSGLSTKLSVLPTFSIAVRNSGKPLSRFSITRIEIAGTSPSVGWVVARIHPAGIRRCLPWMSSSLLVWMGSMVISKYRW